MSYIKVNNASVIYNQGSDNQVNALLDINIEIKQNEFVIFFGPSGCGKTTLLNLISGLEIPTTGSVEVNGVVLETLKRDEMAEFHRKDVGMVFQAYNLIPSLSVLDNVVLPRVFWEKGTKEEREQRAKELLDRFGVLAQANKFPAQLSGGQQQRVGIARALINDQPIILADEPVGNLDSKSAKNVLELLRDLNEKENKTIIMVTHNAENLEFADHVFYIKDGKVIKETFNTERKKNKNEKKTVAEISAEILSKTFIELNAINTAGDLSKLQSKVVANYAVGVMGINQYNQFQYLIQQRLMQAITREEFMLALDRDYEKNGVGLNFQTAKNYFAKIEKLLEVVNRLDDLAKQHPVLNLSVEDLQANFLIRYFLELMDLRLNAKNMNLFRHILVQRLKNLIDDEQFLHALDLPSDSGGVGLDVRVARKITQELQILLLLKLS